MYIFQMEERWLIIYKNHQSEQSYTFKNPLLDFNIDKKAIFYSVWFVIKLDGDEHKFVKIICMIGGSGIASCYQNTWWEYLTSVAVCK